MSPGQNARPRAGPQVGGADGPDEIPRHEQFDAQEEARERAHEEFHLGVSEAPGHVRGPGDPLKSVPHAVGRDEVVGHPLGHELVEDPKVAGTRGVAQTPTDLALPVNVDTLEGAPLVLRGPRRVEGRDAAEIAPRRPSFHGPHEGGHAGLRVTRANGDVDACHREAG